LVRALANLMQPAHMALIRLGFWRTKGLGTAPANQASVPVTIPLVLELGDETR
jgi:hypothetical protein